MHSVVMVRVQFVVTNVLDDSDYDDDDDDDDDDAVLGIVRCVLCMCCLLLLQCESRSFLQRTV